MQVNFDLISGLKISTIYNDIFCCFYNIQAICYSKHHVSIKVKVTQICTFCNEFDCPSPLPPKQKNVR